MDLKTIVRKNYIEKEYVFEINDINVLVISDDNYKPWFYGKNVCELLKYKNTSKTINDHVSKRNKKTFNELKECIKKIPKNAQPHAMFVNKNGFIQLLTAARKENIDEISKMFGIVTIYRYKPKEIEILDELGKFFNELKIKYIPQRRIKMYRVDIFVPEYKLVIEIDENGHKDRNKKYENLREADIKKYTGCKFIRCNPDEEDFNISQFIGKIAKYIMDSK